MIAIVMRILHFAPDPYSGLPPLELRKKEIEQGEVKFV